jgi:Autotransporter beta-domain
MPWITMGPTGRVFVRRWRASACALLRGKGRGQAKTRERSEATDLITDSPGSSGLYRGLQRWDWQTSGTNLVSEQTGVRRAVVTGDRLDGIAASDTGNARGQTTKLPIRALLRLMVVALVPAGAAVLNPARTWAQQSATQALQIELAAQQFSTLSQQDAGLIQTYEQGLQSAASKMSCPMFTQGTLLGEDSCVWSQVSGNRTDQYATGGLPGHRTDDVTYALGGQKEFVPSWFVGGSFAAGTTWTHDDNGGSGDGQIFAGGVAIKHLLGPWLFAGAVDLGTMSNHYSSPLSSLLGGTNIQSDTNTFFSVALFRAAYDFALSHWYIRPRVDFDLIYTHLPAFQASGQSGFAVAVGGLDKVSPVMTPMVEFGGRYDIDRTTILRPYVAVGMSLYPNNTTTGDASVLIDGGTLDTVQKSFKSPSVIGNADVGVQLYRVSGFEVKAEYDVGAANAYLSQSVSLRGAYHF